MRVKILSVEVLTCQFGFLERRNKAKAKTTSDPHKLPHFPQITVLLHIKLPEKI